jgi:hypothetical protein
MVRLAAGLSREDSVVRIQQVVLGRLCRGLQQLREEELLLGVLIQARRVSALDVGEHRFGLGGVPQDRRAD